VQELEEPEQPQSPFILSGVVGKLVGVVGCGVLMC